MRWRTRGVHAEQAAHMAYFVALGALAGGGYGALAGVALCAFAWVLSCWE